MENFYKTLKDREIYIEGFKDNRAQGDYQVFFVDTFLNALIDDVIKKLKVEDIATINSFSDIKLSYEIELYGTTGKKAIYVMGMENKAEIIIPEDTYAEVKPRIIEFFKQIPGTEEVKDFYDPDKLRSIKINTDLECLIIHYGMALPKEYESKKRAIPVVKSVTNKLAEALNAKHSLEAAFVDEVHDRIFEQEFLDKHIVGLIKRTIKDIDNRNLESKSEKNFPVTYEIALDGKYVKDPEMDIEPTYYRAAMDMIDEFMTFYHLGEVIHYSDYDAIRFNTSLNDLMDAYYLEKQRIEYFSHKKEEPEENINEMTF